MVAKVNEIQFSDSDVVNVENFIPTGDYNPHNVRPWLLHDHGFVLAVVFADCLQDALDEACDAGKLDAFKVSPEDYKDYGDTEEEQWERMTLLGNASEPFDIDNVDFIELTNPKFSFAALYSAHMGA